MDDGDYFLLEVFLISFFLIFLTFLAIFEASLHRLTRFDLKLLHDHYRPEKNSVLYLLAHNYIKAIIPLNFGIQLSFIILAILTTHLVLKYLTPFPVLWALGIMFVVNLVFRQLIPRVFTHATPEKKLILLLPGLSFFFPLLRFFSYPIAFVVEKVSKAHVPATEEEKSKELVKREIKTLIDIGREEGVMGKDEGELVKSVIRFGDATAEEVMTPRSQITAIHEGATLKEVKDLMVQEKHSRIPVFRENLDQILGVVYVRHLLTRLEEKEWDASVDDLLLPPVFVSEDKRLSELLKEIKKKRSYMVFVKNDYGGVAGLITIEDLLEEIVGEISDEDQTEEEEIIPQGNNRYLVFGGVSLDKLSDALEVKLEDSDCHSIGGLITKTIGRLPKRNEKIETHGLSVTVLHADSRKVNRLLVEKPAHIGVEAVFAEEADSEVSGPRVL